tara:strand:+ start:313 stop:531 length:219 start_codon:yes stop_codon:yes gene_type:complete
MTIRSKQPKDEIVIDITGPSGNAFSLMAQAKRFAIQLDLNENAILKDMRSGDYEHLLKVFDNHFGHFCTLER